MTYSIGTPPTDATKLADFQSILNILPDNTSKLIAPKDVRDSSYTIWENIVFKPTNAGGDEYIGIDQVDLQEKILIGKKSVGGQYVMNSSLLSTDVDIFFYNTKTEPFASPSTTNYDTTVAFLAGTGSNVSSGLITAPYIKSTVVVNGGTYSNTIDFNIVNPSGYYEGLTEKGGNINILSNNGNIILNGLRFPTYQENIVGSSQDNYILKYKWLGGIPFAMWEQLGTSSTNDTLYSAATVSISGSPVVLNGLPINFTDLTPVPEAIGGVAQYATFSNVPVTEVLRSILYPYIAPLLSTSLNYTLVQAGDTTTANATRLTYTIVKNSTYPITSLILTPGAYSPALVATSSVSNGTYTTDVQPTFNTNVLTGTMSYISYTWSMSLTDGYVTSKTSTSGLKIVIPWYYGTATISCTMSSGVGNINNILGTSYTSVLDKLTPFLAEPALTASTTYNKDSIVLTGNNKYIYFGYPADYPDLSSIYDQNGYLVTSSFKKYLITNVQSPSGNWTGKTYKFYIYVGAGSSPAITTLGSYPSYSVTYKFKFA